MNAQISLMSLVLALTLGGFATSVNSNSPRKGLKRVRVELSGGFETDLRDNGRPVNLVAGALGVPPDVFREAFSHVRPAPAGTEPEPSQVRANKDALLSALGPYGVTNDRLDEVSNYYRYVRSRGEMWPTRPAVIDAIVKNGVVLGFEIKDGGSGYSSPPNVTVQGAKPFKRTIKLSHSREFDGNGAIQSITCAAIN